MRRTVKWLSVAPLLLVLAIAACDSAQQLTSPQANATPQFTVKGGAKRALATVSGGSGTTSVDASGGCTSVYGGLGEELAMLCVPAGTVKKNTIFTIQVAPDYSIELTATSPNSPVQNDVGSAGFEKGVRLYFNTRYIHSGGNLGVAEIKADGQLIPVPSAVVDGWLIGELKHFSGYGPTTDRKDPPADTTATP